MINREDVLKFRGEYRSILWTNLNIDSSYQRNLSPAKVNSIARVFDPDAFGRIVVGERSDGTFWVIDGQHRWRAMQQLGWTDQFVPCHLIKGTTPEEEAKLFDLFNGNRGMPRISDRFKARLRTNDPDALRIKAITNEVGFDIHFGKGTVPKGHIAAVSALVKVHQQGKPGDLYRVLTICREAWGDDSAGTTGDIIQAVHRFASRYREQFDMTYLIERLKGTSPAALTNRGRQIAEVMGTTASIGISRALLAMYNRNKKVGRLPDWTIEGGNADS